MYTKTYKGRFRVANAAKYKGDITNIVYRSLWELKFMKWCDSSVSVVEWGSETVIIPYILSCNFLFLLNFHDLMFLNFQYLKFQMNNEHI